MLTLIKIKFNVFAYGLSGVFLFLDEIVYWIVSKLFALFEVLAGAEIFQQDAYSDIVRKFQVVIGVVMLFYVTYALLKSIINPDDFNKNFGKLVSNIFTSLILLGIVPLIFSYAFSLQDAIMHDENGNIIGNLVLGVTNNRSEDADSVSNTGYKVSLQILKSFLNTEDETIKNDEDVPWNEFWEDAETNKDAILNIGSFAEPVHDGDIEYLPIVSTICGVFLIYVLVSFCIDLGVRVVKLVFYQIIAPIPILMRIISEKKSVFDNWVKASIATYMEVFIRLFIMFIIVYLARLICENQSLFGNDDINAIGKVIIILGLFAFAKQAPKLLGDVIGINSGNIKLGIGGKLQGSGFLGKAIVGTGKMSLGALTGGIGGAYSSAVNHGSLRQGLAYGALQGVKGKGNQFNRQRKAVYNDVLGQKGSAGWFGGQGIVDRMKDQAKKNVQDSYEDSSKNYVERVNNSKKYQDLYANIKKENETKYQELFEQFRKSAEEFERDKTEKIKTYREQYSREEQKFRQDNLNKIMALQNEIDSAEKAKDIARVNMLTSQLRDLQDAKFEDSQVAITLTSQMHQIENSHYENRDLQAEMEKIPHTEEAYALATEKALAKEDRRYKANREYVQNRAAEKAAKEWREANPTEAAINQEMLNKMFDNYTKEHGGAPAAAKPPSASAGSSGSSSSGSSGKK